MTVVFIRVIAAPLLGRMSKLPCAAWNCTGRRHICAPCIEAHSSVTILGSLIDSVIDATGECGRRRQVAVEARIDEATRLQRPGLPR